MDFDSPEVMKDFPGLYATELNKKCRDDSDFSDEGAKNEASIGKKKDKKDKKDKEKGYAALEGESSGDENSKSSRSPSKYKKSKSFKFPTSKSKERRDKSKEKDVNDKKKDKEKKQDKKYEKEKIKNEKHRKVKSGDENYSLGDALPIFGVPLDIAVERSKCHDGLDIPLPVRQCIDYLETAGLFFDGIYKISGTKSKVIQIRKMFNHRENVDLFDYDVPTSTSLLKMFLRDLPEPLFTNDLLIRFEEAGAILSSNTREKHLRILVDNLPPLNKLLLSWLLIHLDNVSQNEKVNKMGCNNLGASLNHTFHVSSRLLTALIHHARALFPELVLTRYIPPLPVGATLPSSEDEIQIELAKQESLLNQIHMEINSGCTIKEREELLWEVQRIITQLKRKIKTFKKDKEMNLNCEKVEEKITTEIPLPEDPTEEKNEPIKSIQSEIWAPNVNIQEVVSLNILPEGRTPNISNERKTPSPAKVENDTDDHRFEREISPDLETELPHNYEKLEENTTEEPFDEKVAARIKNLDRAITLTKMKNHSLLQLRENLIKSLQSERTDIINLKRQIMNKKDVPPSIQHKENIDTIMSLLQKENQILQIKKINLTRQITEQQEICIDLRARIELHQKLMSET